MKRTLVFLAALFSSSLSLTVLAQTNLADPSVWSVGNGSVTGFFYRFGTDAENIREVGTDPYGNSGILWKAVPDGAVNADGGWDTKYYSVDPSKDFRFHIWIKKTNSQDGNTLFGFHGLDGNEAASTRRLDGTSISAPYFYWGDLPTLDEWYLLVGYVYGHGHTDQTHQGGIYNSAGVKVAPLTDFKLSTNTTFLVHRTYLYTDPNTADAQYFSHPGVYEVNGQEPTISEIINPGGGSGGGGESVWVQNGTDINYDAGQVSIGTTTVPAGYNLAVSGKIIADEIKVQLVANWPDYVFDPEYPLPSLEEVQKYIGKYGHLENVPSAEKAEKEGVELGEMNKILLAKIEELTLYAIQQNQLINKLNEKTELLSKEIKMLKTGPQKKN